MSSFDPLLSISNRLLPTMFISHFARAFPQLIWFQVLSSNYTSTSYTLRRAFIRSVPLRISHPSTATEMKTQIAHEIFAAAGLALSHIEFVTARPAHSWIPFPQNPQSWFRKPKLTSSTMSKMMLNDETVPRQAQA